MSSTQSSLDQTVRPPSGARLLLLRIAELRAWLFLAVLLVFFEAWSQIAYGGSFIFKVYTAQSIAIYAVAPLLLALGSTFVIISGGIDLSIGFIMGLSAVVAAHAANIAGLYVSPFPAMLVGVVVGVAIAIVPGYVNGLLISRLRVPPFIGTLGMYGVARGVAYLLAGGTTVPVSNPWFSEMGNGRLLGVPTVVVITVLFLILMHYILSQTKFGQHTYAIGASEQAALRAGINVSRHLRRLYVLSAICAGVGGVLYTARFTAGAAQAGEPLLLDSIAAVVIGGASLFGGSGSISGTVAGSLVIAVIQFGLVYINVEPFWQFVSVGVVIIISVLVDQAQRSISGGRRS